MHKENKMKLKIFIGVAIVVAAAAAVFIMMMGDSKPSPFEVSSGNLIIGGSFGITVPVSDVTGLDITEAPPEIETKTNGSGLGSMYKGEFELKDGTKARLYIDASKPPFIIFKNGDTVFYLNSGTPEETQALYQKLSEELK
jgi:hypothetical protein